MITSSRLRACIVRNRRKNPELTISRGQFDRLVRAYEPLAFEVISATARRRFPVPTHNVLKNRDRLWLAIKTASSYFPLGSFAVADLGTYPGSLLRLLRRLFSPETCRLVGVGLMTSDEFRRAMAEDCRAEIMTVNLNLRNEQLREKGYPTRIPLEDGNIQLVFALEVIEHLVSPSHLFAEASQILAPGGHLIVTTPNVTRIGNVFKLVVGRSNFDRLIPLDYDHPEDEWRPHFREYTLAEVCEFFRQAGLQVVEARHLVGENTRYEVKTITQRLIDIAKRPFYVVPHFRGSLLVIGTKIIG